MATRLRVTPPRVSHAFPGDHMPDRMNRLASDLSSAASAAARSGRDHRDHPDAAVEGPQHLGLLDAALGLQPVEDLRPVPGVELDPRAQALGQHPRQVLGQPAAGDMGQRMHSPARIAASAGFT